MSAERYSLPSVIRGTRAPEALGVTVSAGTSGVDLSTVTAARLLVHGIPRRGEQTWATTIETQTAAALDLRHVFDAAGAELADPCVARVIVVLTLPSGEIRVGPFSLAIVDW